MFEEVSVTIDNKPVFILLHKDSPTNKKNFIRPPCFILGLSSHYHDKFSKKFCEFYQLVLIDLYWTNSQFSKSYIQSLTLDRLAHHIEEVRAQLEMKRGQRYKKIFVCTHSAYCFIGFAYQKNYKNRIEGMMVIAGVPLFKADWLEKLQENHLNSNFGHKKVNGPTERWHEYYRQKQDFLSKVPSQDKISFIQWYLSMGALLWKEKKFWKNENDSAKKLWAAWKILISSQKNKAGITKKYDINMVMLFHFISLIENRTCYDLLSHLTTPMLWIVGLYDARASLYLFEENNKLIKTSSSIIFRYVNGGHWPMFPKDADTQEFDRIVIQWGEENINKPNLNLYNPQCKL